ncbi:MAG TPA: zf-TFIIB domain-containing protein [Candidatus Binatia bacterium]|nr:zf-TFIIB domain-containing protein [Candidatus Binatia bacterium]
MKLVSCPNCHAQYDVSRFPTETVACRCGTTFPAQPPAPRDSAVRRCASCGALLRGAEQTCSYCQAEVVRQPQPTGPVCPECYARNPEGARHCTACGLAFLPQPMRTRAEALTCPVCAGIVMASRNVGGLWLDECPQCLGLWAPGDVMDRLVDKVEEKRRTSPPSTSSSGPRERQSAWQEEVVYRHCPECRGAMQRKNFGTRSGVVVDWCGSHGTWLDAHEMEDIASFVLAGGLDRTTAGTENARGVLPADPSRTAAILAAEQLVVDERARSRERERAVLFGTMRGWKGIGDLFEHLLK